MEASLGALLDKSTGVEAELVAEVLDAVGDEPAAADYFLSELEIASELVFVGDKQDQAALLLCLPVIFMAGDTPRRLALSTDCMHELASVLTETDVVGAQAKVGLLPRLFAPCEVVTQSYGALRKLTQMLGEQLLAGDPVRLLPGVLSEDSQPSDRFAWGDNPYMELRYIVGVVLTHETMLDEVFPAVGPETLEADLARLKADVASDELTDQLANVAPKGRSLEHIARAGDSDSDSDRHPVPPALPDETEPGQTAQGEYWEDVFLDTVDEVFVPMFGAHATSLPDDFHENVRRGLELWRETGVQHQVSQVFHPDERVFVYAKPYTDHDTGRMGWDLHFFGEYGTLRDQGPWELLMHEDADDAKAALDELCGISGWMLVEFDPLFADH